MLVILIVLSIILTVLKAEFTQTMIISKNIFLNNQKSDRIITPHKLYKLAMNIENVWSASKPNSIPKDKSIFTIRDFKDWFINSADIRSTYPETSIDVKAYFGFYSSSPVCLPDFYSKSVMTLRFSFALICFNLILIIFISVGYIFIFT